MADIEDLLQQNNLKKARLQDKIIELIFKNVKDAVFHGGTCIWRCYGGKRFSKDIDIYIAKQSSIKKVLNRLIQEGFDVKTDTQRRLTFFYTVHNSTDVSLQIHNTMAKGEITRYLETDGTAISVYALTPESLILEKISAYKDRRLERDLYDIMILTNSVKNKSHIIKQLNEFLNHLDKPKDKGALSGLIYDGIHPTFEDIAEYLKRWCLP